MGLDVENIRRVGIIVSATKVSYDEILHPLKINISDNKFLTINQGKEIGEEKRDWSGGLSIFASIYKDKERSVAERVEAAVWASQMLINLSRPNQANGILKSAFELLPKLKEDEFKILEARIYEKRAWVANIEARPKKALNFLKKADELFSLVEGDLPPDAKKSRATMIHFYGRTYFSLGEIDKAKKYFFDDLNRLKEDRRLGKADPAGEAFNHAWLARCFAYNEQFESAHQNSELALDLFNEEIDARTKSGHITESERGIDMIAHYCLVKAEILLCEGKPYDAIAFAGEAKKIRSRNSPKYDKGMIEASLVLRLAKFQAGISDNV